MFCLFPPPSPHFGIGPKLNILCLSTSISVLPSFVTELICLTLNNEGYMPRGNCDIRILGSIVRMQRGILCISPPQV